MEENTVPFTDQDAIERRESRDRLIRVESTVDHLQDQLNDMEIKQNKSDASSAKSFSELREGALRLQIATENLVKAVEEQNRANKEKADQMGSRLTVVENKIDGIYKNVYAITVVGGLIWMLFGTKILSLLGI